MPQTYETFGPFVFEETKHDTYKQSLKKFWDARSQDESTNELCDAVGVYVWTVTKRGKTVPWNVGRTDTQGFKKRFLQKELALRKLRDSLQGGEVQVFLIALKTPGGKFRRATKSSKRLAVNEWLETMLIGSSRSVNPELRNLSKVKFLRDIRVDGYWNDEQKRRSASGRALNALFTGTR